MASTKVKELYERYIKEPAHADSAAILLNRYPELGKLAVTPDPDSPTGIKEKVEVKPVGKKPKR